MNFEGPFSKISKVYYKLPVSLQNLAFSIGGYINKRNRFGDDFQQKFKFLRESEWFSASEMEDYQNRRLEYLLKNVYPNVPLIKDTFDQNGIRFSDIKNIEDLKKLPIISKDTLRNSSLQYRNLAIPSNHVITALTSGTSGRQLKVFHTKETLSAQWATWARHKARFGIFQGDKYLSFGARVPILASQSKPPFWRRNYALNQVYLSTFHLSKTFLPDIIDFINNETFDYYTGYPSSMYVLASYMKENNIKLLNRPKYVVTGSDALLPQFEKVISEVFGVKVTEQYGMAEACGNYSKCEYGMYHLDAEFGISELIPVDNMPGKYRLVFTSMANDAMPLIRYDMGDYGVPEDMQCKCGRHTPILSSIEGRLEDFITTPDGRKISGMNQVFEWAPNINEIQVYQNDPSSIEVRFIPSLAFVRSELNNLEIEFRKRLGHEIIINFVEVNSIQRSKTGKYKAVISEIKS